MAWAEPTTTPAVQSDIHVRVLTLLALAADYGYKFLDQSDFASAFKPLIAKAAQTLIKKADAEIRKMSEADIREQVSFIRDQVIPFILQDQDEAPIEQQDNHQ